MRYVNNPNANFVANGIFFPMAAVLFYAASELTNSDKKVVMTSPALAALAAVPSAVSAALTRFSQNPTEAERKIVIEKLQLVGTAFMFSAIAMLLNETAATASRDKPDSEFAAGAMALFCGHVLANLLRQVFNDLNAARGLITDVLGLAGVSLFFVANGITLHALRTLLNNSDNEYAKYAADIKLFITALFVLIIGNGMRQNTHAQSAASYIADTTKSAATRVASATNSLWKQAKICCTKKDVTEKTGLLNGV